MRAVAPAAQSPDLLAGPEGYDDAGAVRMADGRVSLHTVDFFPPVLDDLESYGAIAAANSLSDIYASGGEAKIVLNLAGFPEDWDEEVMAAVFRGAVAKIQEAGALWVGGHSVRSQEPLFGFAIYGEVSEDELITNGGARPGDRLVLTKPIGAGSITTGVKLQRTSDEDAATAAVLMGRLNRAAAQAMRVAGVKAATDITGFGLLGHAANLARASQVELRIEASALPLYPGAEALARDGVMSGGSTRGRETLAEVVDVADSVDSWLSGVCFDAETSGGLLVAVPADALGTFLAAVPDEEGAVVVGEVRAGGPRVHLV